MLLSTSSSSGPPLGLMSCTALPPFPQVATSSVCITCLARGNLFCEKAQSGTLLRQWKCVFCNTWNTTQAVFEQANEFAYSSYEVVAVNPTMPTSSNHHAILVIDETLPARELKAICLELQAALDTLPDDFYLGLITFARSVRIYELASTHLLACEVFSGVESPAVEDIRQIAKHERESTCSFVSPLYVCRQTVCDILSVLSTTKEDDDNDVPFGTEDRCLGPALEYAFNLIKIHDAANSCIVCTTFGRGTRGPGRWKVLVDEAERTLLQSEHALACEYFSAMQQTFQTTHVHMFACGPSLDFGLPALLALTPHVYFDSVANAHTLRNALAFNPLHTAPRIDVVCSEGLFPMHICGGGATAQQQQQHRGMTWHFPANDTLTVFLSQQQQPATTSDDAYVQWIAQEHGRERVGTEKISSFGAVNEDACAVLIAKRAVAIALLSEEDAKRHVSNELYNLSRSLPHNQFERIALPLYHFYRGPLLCSTATGSQYKSDDLLLDRERFLNQTDFVAALLMICPKLFAVRRRGATATATDGVIEMPLSTLCLESDTCLVLDQYSMVIVWYGNDAGEAERQRALELAQRLTSASNRYPASRVLQCREADNQAAWLRARLSPEHKTSSTQSNATNSAVDSSSTNRALMTKLWNLPCDDMTYAKFIKQVLEG